MATTAPKFESEDKLLTRWLFVALGAYFGLRVMVRAVVDAGIVDLDEAQQVVWSQWWALGYGGEPPLYTWLQKLCFGLFGVNVFALALLKNVLMFGACAAIYGITGRLLSNVPHRLLGTLSLMLIPHWAWEAQQGLLPTTLAVALGAAALLVALELLRRPATWWFVTFGACLGLGVLAAYPFLMFAVALLATLASFDRGRQLLRDRRMQWAGGVGVALVLPHLVWLGFHWQVLTPTDSAGLLTRLGQLVAGVIWIGGIAGIVVTVLFRNHVFWRRPKDLLGPVSFPLGRLVVAGMGMAGVVALLAWGRKFEAHWLLPVLFVFPLWLMTRVDPVLLQPDAWKRIWQVFGVILGSAVAAGFLAHQHFPTFEVAERARSLGFERGVVVADTPLLAGNLRLEFPGSTVCAARLGTGVPPHVATNQTALIVWDLGKHKQVPDATREWLRVRFQLDADRLSPVPLRMAFGRGRNEFADIRIIVLKPAAAAKLRGL
jgi:hypothetical protein